MNKKFLSAILFGALMVTSTGTFVSCKDYDDEIDDLQEQINKLATKEDMTSQIASLQSALTAAQSEAAAAKASAEDAVKKATDASSAATEAEKAAAQAALDAANAKAEAIKAAQDEVAKVKAELEASIDSKFEAAKGEFAETIAELTKKVEGLTGYTTSMVTGLNFVDNNNNDTNLDLKYFRLGKIYFPKDLAPNPDGTTLDGDDAEYTDPVASYNFAEGMTGAFTVKEKDVNTVPDQMLVNVDPVNAALPADMLSLMNSNGVNLNDYVDITSKTYNGTLTVGPIEGRASSSTGLREIGVQLKNTVDFAAFDKLVLVGGNHVQKDCDQADKHEYIAYALTASDAQGHVVTSPYKVNMHVVEEEEAIEINKYTGISSTAVVSGKTIFGYQKNTGDQSGSDEGCFAIKNGETFTISVGSNPANGKVMASYVVLASKTDAGLTETDVVALQSMKIDGLKNVLKGASQVHKITVTGAAIPVPLKLVTIDYTGKVKVNMIWVKASEPVLISTAFTATPKSHVADDEVNAWTVNTGEKVAFTIPENASKYSVSLTVGEYNLATSPVSYTGENISIANNGTLNAANGKAFLKLYEADKKTPATENKKVAYAEFVGTVNLQVMKEDKDYEGVIKFYTAEGTYIGSNAVMIKKVLPTTIPAGLTAKTGVIHADGSMPIYPKPQEDKTGEFELSQAFIISDGTNGTLNLVDDANLKFNTELIVNKDFDPTKHVALYSDRKITKIVSNKIGEDTKYPTTVTYDYGDIKYHEGGHGVDGTDNCIVEWATKFDIVLGCYVKDSQFAWYTEPSVVYSQDKLIAAYDATAKKYVDYMTAKSPYLVDINPFDAALTNTYWIPWAMALNKPNFESSDTYKAVIDDEINLDTYTIELWSNGDKNRVNEFFKAEVVEVDENGKETTTAPKATALKLVKNPSSTAVPENDVPTTVVFKFNDKFGHAEAIKALTFTMKKNAAN